MAKLTRTRLSLISLLLITLSISAAWLYWREDGRRAVPASGTAIEHKRMYVCPMHPQVRQESPGDCPICGMHLELEDNSSGMLMSHMDEHEHDQAPVVSGNAQSILGLRTARAESRDLNMRIHTVARVVADGGNEQVVTAPADGWIRHLHVAHTGVRVATGTPLFEFYSPDLEQRQRDYIDSLNRRDQLLNSITNMAGQNGEVLASLARERKRLRESLLRLGVATTTLDAIEKFRRPLETLTIVSRQPGLITAVSAREGAAVGPLSALYTVVNNNAVQIDVLLAPSQLAALSMPVQLELVHGSVHDDEKISASLSLKQAVFNSALQSYSVRTSIVSPAGEPSLMLQPGAVLDVDVVGEVQHTLAVPREALLEGANGSFVVAMMDANHFVPRRVTSGVVDQHWVGIDAGLEAGDIVVTDGQFMLDAASTFERTFAGTAIN